MLNQNPNIAMLHALADEVVNEMELEAKPYILQSFLCGVDALRGYINDGLESHYLKMVEWEITRLKECAPAQKELKELFRKLNQI